MLYKFKNMKILLILIIVPTLLFGQKNFNYQSGNEKFEILILASLEGYIKPTLKKGADLTPIGFAYQADTSIGLLNIPGDLNTMQRIQNLDSTLNLGLNTKKFLAIAYCYLGSNNKKSNNDRVGIYLKDISGSDTTYIVPFISLKDSIKFLPGYFSVNPKLKLK